MRGCTAWILGWDRCYPLARLLGSHSESRIEAHVDKFSTQAEWMCADTCAAPEDTVMTCDDCTMGIQASLKLF